VLDWKLTPSIQHRAAIIQAKYLASETFLPNVSQRETENARAWAGQAENPPKPRWAFGWFASFHARPQNACRVYDEGGVKQGLCQC
jgi:hypothetical protein